MSAPPPDAAMTEDALRSMTLNELHALAERGVSGFSAGDMLAVFDELARLRAALADAEADTKLGAALRAALATVPNQGELRIFVLVAKDRATAYAAGVHPLTGDPDDNAECRALAALATSTETGT